MSDKNRLSVSKMDLMLALQLDRKLDDDDNIESIIATEKGLEITGHGRSKDGRPQEIHVIIRPIQKPEERDRASIEIEREGTKTIIK